jgi:predicted  nucleic acid-binding Zn-ribbon protein
MRWGCTVSIANRDAEIEKNGGRRVKFPRRCRNRDKPEAKCKIGSANHPSPNAGRNITRGDPPGEAMIRVWTKRLWIQGARPLLFAACISGIVLPAAATRADEVADLNAKIAAHKKDLAEYASALQTQNANVRNFQNDAAAYESDVQRLKSEAEGYRTTSATYESDVTAQRAAVARYESAVANHNAEAKSYNSEVQGYNALPANQRTQFQKDRLDRWKADLENRASQLNSEKANLNSRKAGLDNRKAYLDVKRSEIQSTATRLDGRRADLERRRTDINQRKAELDSWASRINQRAATLTAEGKAINSRSQANSGGTPTNSGQSNQSRPNGGPTKPALDQTAFGRGDGGVPGGATFPDATDAHGSVIIDGTEFEWRARLIKDITNAANNLYRTQIWEFKLEEEKSTSGKSKIVVKTATATVRGSETGASGDAFGWVVNENGKEVKIVAGVQFSGDKARILTIHKDIKP